MGSRCSLVTKLPLGNAILEAPVSRPNSFNQAPAFSGFQSLAWELFWEAPFEEPECDRHQEVAEEFVSLLVLFFEITAI